MSSFLFLPLYGKQGASSRERFWNLSEYCQEKGHKIKISNLFSENSTKKFQKGKKRNKVGFMFSFLKRNYILFNNFGVDIIVVEKTLYPYLGLIISPILLIHKYIFNTKIIYDFDDAVNLIYKLPNPINKKFIDLVRLELLMNASDISLGNRYLKKILRLKSHYFNYPTPLKIGLNCSVNIKADNLDQNPKLKVLWIGSRTTSPNIYKLLFKLIGKIDSKKFEFYLCGCDSVEFSEEISQNFKIMNLPWSLKIQNDLLQSCDIGLMPLIENTLWERGKCGYKLILYNSYGLPCIASPKGINRELLSYENGLLSHNIDDWISNLNVYLNDKKLRKKHGNNGYEIVSKKFSHEVIFMKWLSNFSEI